MFNELNFLHWIFERDDEVLFVIFAMRIARCNQSGEVKEHILKQGWKAIRQLIDKKIKRLQDKQRIPTITQAFYLAVEKTIQKTMSYSYPAEDVANLLKTLIELHIKHGNPSGIQQYLSKISNTVKSLLPEKDTSAWKKFQQFWYPIYWHDWYFMPQYYRERMNQLKSMRIWLTFIFVTIMVTIVATICQFINPIIGLSVIGGAIVTNYIVRTAWRFAAIIQSKLQLSKSAEQENHQLILELIGLRIIKYIPKPKEKIINTDIEKIDDKLDLVPNWHEEIYHKKQRSLPRFYKHDKDENISLETPLKTPELSKAFDSLIVQWKELKPPLIYNSIQRNNNIFPLYSHYISYNSIFCRLHPNLSKVMSSVEFEHFKKVVERGRIISRKSKGLQGIKPSFRQYKTINGEVVYSDYKLKIPKHDGRVFGHMISVSQQENKIYTLIDFDGYDPKAHKNAKRK